MTLIGSYLDFSYLIELKKIYITDIYIEKQYKSSRIKNKKKIKKKKNLIGVPLKGYVTSKVILRFGARNKKHDFGNIQWLLTLKFIT